MLRKEENKAQFEFKEFNEAKGKKKTNQFNKRIELLFFAAEEPPAHNPPIQKKSKLSFLLVGSFARLPSALLLCNSRGAVLFL